MLFFCWCSFLIGQQTPISKEGASKIIHIKKEAQEKVYEFDGPDGPYIINDTLFKVNKKKLLVFENQFNSDSLPVQVSNVDEDTFHVAIQSNYKSPPTNFDMPNKMVVISDIEGKFNAFSSFLMANKVIDKNYDWIFDDGHLVLVGDFVDRGRNVTQVLWLIYKLEYQAQEKGGHVHFILGNHEVLNFKGDHRYNSGKYIKVAQEISGQKDKKKAIQYMYSKRSELGKWVATKNVVEKIGDYIFVHAGLSPQLTKYKHTLDDINTNVRNFYTQKITKQDTTAQFLYGSKGPFWYRGFVMPRSNYEKINSTDLDHVLNYYKAKTIVVGHTIVSDIKKSFEGRILLIDVSHSYEKHSGKTKGVLIENGLEYKINDLGTKSLLVQ